MQVDEKPHFQKGQNGLKFYIVEKGAPFNALLLTKWDLSSWKTYQ